MLPAVSLSVFGEGNQPAAYRFECNAACDAVAPDWQLADPEMMAHILTDKSNVCLIFCCGDNTGVRLTHPPVSPDATSDIELNTDAGQSVERPAETAWKQSGNAVFRCKCGLLHSDPAVVGRKSGPPKITDAEFCTMRVIARRDCRISAQAERTSLIWRDVVFRCELYGM